VRYLHLLWARVSRIVLYGDTASMRLWLSLVEILLGLYLWNAAHITPYFESMLASLPVTNPIFWYSTLFWVHSLFLIAGLTGRYSVWTLMFEGVMGWCLWGIVAISNTVQQGFPGPFSACWLVMTWILIRYPTHWVRWGERDD
jgi:hypothetical protein